jgi:hypothetical protein
VLRLIADSLIHSFKHSTEADANMSTSCTSAALAATTSGSSGLARNTTGGTCAASLYASIDLHSGKRRRYSSIQ